MDCGWVVLSVVQLGSWAFLSLHLCLFSWSCTCFQIWIHVSRSVDEYFTPVATHAMQGASEKMFLALFLFFCYILFITCGLRSCCKPWSLALTPILRSVKERFYWFTPVTCAFSFLSNINIDEVVGQLGQLYDSYLSVTDNIPASSNFNFFFLDLRRIS